jgi:hypothetical protein
MWTYSTCLNINAELLLVSTLKCTMGIVFCPLVVVAKIYNTVSNKTIRFRNSTGKLSTLLNKPPTQ